MHQKIKNLVESKAFEYFIVTLILFNGVVLGLETSPDIVAQYGAWLEWSNHVVLGVFIIEALLKMAAVAPRISLYFKDGWNCFDFSVVLLSLVPATGQFAMIARLARLLRVVRLISTIPELRLIVTTLVKSIPSMGHVIMLMGIIFYIYAVAGYHLLHQHDPEHWRNLGISLLTLFRVVTLEDWTDVMYKAMEMHPLMWIYFVSFVVLGTFVIINLFIAVVLNNLDEAKHERLMELQQASKVSDMLHELKNTQKVLKKLEDHLHELHQAENNSG